MIANKNGWERKNSAPIWVYFCFFLFSFSSPRPSTPFRRLMERRCRRQWHNERMESVVRCRQDSRFSYSFFCLQFRSVGLVVAHERRCQRETWWETNVEKKEKRAKLSHKNKLLLKKRRRKMVKSSLLLYFTTHSDALHMSGGRTRGHARDGAGVCVCAKTTSSLAVVNGIKYTRKLPSNKRIWTSDASANERKSEKQRKHVSWVAYWDGSIRVCDP